MAIEIAQEFKRTGAFALDETFVLTKAQMLAINEDQMPDVYFAVCKDDGKFYIYDKNSTPSTETGYYHELSGGGGGIDDITFVAPAYDKTKTYALGDVVTYDGKRYVANTAIDPAEDPFNPAHWDVQDIQAAIDSVSGDASIGYNFTTNIDVGGLKSGTAITADMKLADIVKNMLTTVYYPTYVAPKATLNYGAPSLAKVGSNISALSATLAFDAGAINLQGAKQANRAGDATEFKLISAGATTDVNETNATGSFSVPAITRATKGNVTFTGTVSYAEGPQPKDSAGEDYQTPLQAGTVTASKTVEFILPFVHGVSDSMDITSFAGMIEDLKKKGNQTYDFATNNQHVVFAYDSAYGDLTSIKDKNDFETISGYEKTVVTVDGQNYNVYVQRNKTIDAKATNTFKF